MAALLSDGQTTHEGKRKKLLALTFDIYRELWNQEQADKNQLKDWLACLWCRDCLGVIAILCEFTSWAGV